jgi:hypothetical protein
MTTLKEVDMFARNVSFHLKSNMLSDYTRTFDKDILPLLRRQNGFKDEITFSSPGGTDVTAISLWDNKANAEAYHLARVTGEVVNSTFHKIVATVAA